MLCICEAAPKIEAEFQPFTVDIVVVTGDINLKRRRRGLIDFPQLSMRILGKKKNANKQTNNHKKSLEW